MVLIVLDDVSDINKYKKLEKLEYVMMSVEHKLLSKCIELWNLYGEKDDYT